LVKFLFVGGTGMIVDLSIYSVLWLLLGLDLKMVWQVISFGAAVTWNFAWNKKWTFAAGGSGPSQFAKFLAIAVIALGIRTLLYQGGISIMDLTEGWETDILLFGVILIVTVVNFAGSKLWAFRTDGSNS
jgi:putative flippase GtrA